MCLSHPLAPPAPQRTLAEILLRFVLNFRNFHDSVSAMYKIGLRDTQ
jgi:hypothetical protein